MCIICKIRYRKWLIPDILWNFLDGNLFEFDPGIKHFRRDSIFVTCRILQRKFPRISPPFVEARALIEAPPRSPTAVRPFVRSCCLQPGGHGRAFDSLRFVHLRFSVTVRHVVNKWGEKKIDAWNVVVAVAEEDAFVGKYYCTRTCRALAYWRQHAGARAPQYQLQGPWPVIDAAPLYDRLSALGSSILQ